MKTLKKFEAKKFILISFLFIFSLNIFANGNSVIVTTYAGTGFVGSQDGDALTEAKFGLPTGISGFGTGICFDNEGNLLVADAGNNKIRKISPTGMVTTIAGAGIGFLDGPANIARFDFLADIAVDSIGNIYIADGNNNRIRKLDTSGIVSTLAGSGICGSADGFGVSATFCLPTGVEIDKGGNIIVADLNGNAIRKVTPAGNVTTIKLVNNPIQVALDGAGNIFYISSLTNRVLKIDTNGIETLIAGSTPGFADGTGATAKFNEPWGIALDNDGNIYIGDQQNHRVRKIDTNNVVTTWAGTGVAGFKDGPADSAQFNGPSGLCHDASGSIFVADQNNNRIRKIAVPIEEEVTIEGAVFVDKDTSCNITVDDFGIKDRIIKIQQLNPARNFYEISDNLGNFNFKGPSGDYMVSLINNLGTTEACQNTIYNYSLANGEEKTNTNFLIQSDCSNKENLLFIDPFPFNAPCPGMNFEICAIITNSTTHEIMQISPLFIEITNGTENNITIIPVATSSGCYLANTNGTPIGKGRFAWDITSTISPNSSCEICIQASIPSNVDVEAVPKPEFSLNIISGDWQCIGTDNNLIDTDSLNNVDIIVCEGVSLDPNNKLVSPTGCGSAGKIVKNEPLIYKINFQNIGTAPAHNIIIKDTLDNEFDIATLSIFSSSHPVTKFSVKPENVLVWKFENINLPDSSSDPEGSTGFVRFMISHLPGLPDGTEITNNASIIFDTNEPIITNTTLNTIFDNPNPVASFSVSRHCVVNAYNFTYTGSAENVTIFWNFGIDAIPKTASGTTVNNVIFETPGLKEISMLVEDIDGCSSFLTNTINVEDISCSENKILICHRPPGNMDNPQQICINKNSLQAHLEHGDCIGSCAFTPSAKSSSTVDASETIISDFNTNNIDIYPVPFNNSLNINYNNYDNSSPEIEIYNTLGEQIKVKKYFSNTTENNIQYLLNTDTLPEGIYILKIKHQNNLTVKKVIKIK